MKRIFAFLFLIEVCCVSGWTQTIACPWPWRITSDFGPRDVNTGTWFHQGVDYFKDGSYGTPIPSVESGNIIEIANTAKYGSFYNVKIQGGSTGDAWLYGHIFREGEDPSGKIWELAFDVEHVNPYDESIKKYGNVIIQWADTNHTHVAKILSTISDYRVKKSGVYLTTQDNADAWTQRYVFIGQNIAIMGDAFADNVHLHLGLNYPDDNPLVHLIHTPDALPVATIVQPQNEHVVTDSEINDYVFVVEVDSILGISTARNGGIDLDKISFWIYPNKNETQEIHLGTPGLPTFGYGGRAGESQNGFPLYSSTGGTGVKPFSVANDSLGHDRFIFHQNLTALNLPDGKHSFVVKCKDVNDNDACLGPDGTPVSVDFTINTAPPIVEFIEPLAGIYDLNVVASPLALVAGTASKELASVEVGLSHSDGTWWDGHAWTPTEIYHAGNFAYSDPDGQPGNFWFYSGFDGVDNSRVELSNTYTLHVKALDLAGQVAAPKQQVITIQKAEATEPGAYIDSLNGIHGYIDPYSVHSSFTGIDGHTVGSTDKVQLSITRMDDGYGWNGNAWSNIPDAACSPYNPVCLNNIGISSNKWEYSTGLPTLETGKLYQIKALGYKDFGTQPDPMPSELWFCYSLPSQQQRCLYKGYDEKTLIFDKTPPLVAIDAIDFTASDLASKVNLTVDGTIGNDETGAIPDAASAQVSIIDVTDPSSQQYWNGSVWITGENIMYLGANYNKDADKWTYNMVGGALSKNRQYVIRARAFDIAGNQSLVKKRPLNITLLSAALLDMYSLLSGQIVSNHSLTLNVITSMLERAKNTLLAANLKYLAHFGFDVAGSDVVLKYPVSPETLAQYPPDRLGVYRFVPGGLPAEDTLEQVYSYFNPVESILYAYTDVSGLYLMAASGPANTDTTAPETVLTISGKYVDEAAQKVYVSASSKGTLTAVDDFPPQPSSVYAFDPSPELLVAGLNSGTVSQFTTYAGEFSLPAGVRTIAYGSYNQSGLYEYLKTVTVYMDVTAPLTNILVAGVVVNNGVIEAQEGAAITFGRSDAGEISSGVKDTFYKVDDGAEIRYDQTVILPVGVYTIHYYSIDNVGNRELTDGVAQITIIADTTPPVTHLMVNGQEIADGASANILDNDDISVLAEDSSGSGVTVYYSKDTALTIDTRVQYLGQPFVLPPGPHIVYYTAYDTAGNMAAIKSANFTVIQNLDTAPPVSSLIRVGEHFPEDTGNFVAPSTLLHVYATDNNPGFVNSGLDKTYYKVAGAGETLPETLDVQTAVLFNTEPPDFALPEGEWRVAYGARDIAGNYEQLKVETIYSDGTPPVVNLTITGTIGQNGWYISDVAGEAEVTDVNSGVRQTYYILNNSKWPGPKDVNAGSGQIAEEDGVYSGFLRALDNVGNLTEQPLGFKIDKTPPSTQASIHGNCNNGDCDPGVSVALNSADATSGPGNIYYSLDNGAYGDYSGPIAFDADGQYTIRYYATDQAGNAEAPKTVNVKVRTRQDFTTFWTVGISIGGVLSGNTSIPVTGEVVSPPVTIPAAPIPPTLDLGESGSLFMDWRGVNTNTAHTIETEFPLTIKDTDDGLKSVVITGPGVAIDQQYEVPDISVTYQYSFGGLEPGSYNISATDKQGNVTSVMFEIGTLDLIPAQTRSAGTYDAEEDTFTARVEADFASSFGLAGAEYFVDGSTEIVPLSGASASEKFYSKKGFKAYNFDPPAVLTPYLPEVRDYWIRVIDRYGYYKALAYNITGEGNSSYSHPNFGTPIETPLTDVLTVYPTNSSQVLLPGAMRPFKDVLSYGELLWSQNLWAESGYNTAPGVCVPHSGNFGSINFQVKSGDSSVALTEDAVLTRTLYFATYSSPNPPANCVKFAADGGSQCPGHPGTEHAVCYQDVYTVPGVPAVPPVTAVPSKRFYQIQAAASDSSINVFVSNGVDDHPLAAGYPFSKRFSVSAGFNDYLWGLVFKAEDIKGGSNLAPEGQNVAVKMGGVLDVAIDSVLNAGQSALTMTSASLPNGRISLSGGIAWRMLPRPGASPETGGYITLGFPLGPEYTSLTSEQKDGIRVFRITDGVYEMLPTDVDAAAGKATVAVQSLYGSSYMLTAPAYSAAYSSETEEMGVISGDPEAVAGRHGRTFQQGQSISAALAAKGVAPVTDFYDINSPVSTAFTPAATIVFAAVAGAETAHLYAFNADATVLEKLPEQIITIAGRRYHAASVAQAHPYYALLQQVVIPPAAGFSATGSMLTARGVHTETLLPNGKVLVVGGRNAGGFISSAELYDPVAKTFTTTGSLNSARAYHTATLLPNGKVLVTGGWNGSSSLSSSELYDPIAGAFTVTGSMTVGRDSHIAKLLASGKVLIAGGGKSDGGTLSSAEIYDPATGTFAATGSMSKMRQQCAAILLPNGKVLVAGGTPDGTAGLTSVELYDPSAGTFSATGSMSVARWRHAAALLPSGKVLVAGGAHNGVTVSSAELYDPATGAFSPTGSMGSVRQVFTATLLPSGKVLIAAGSDASAPLTSAELYDPVAGTFFATASLGHPRSSHGAALLADGKVLLTGGHDGTGYISSSELYDSGSSVPVSIVLESINLIPSSATINIGANQQFTATGNFSDGSSRALGAMDGLVWSTDNSAVATVGPDGLATGVGAGAAHITVSSGIISAEANLAVGVIPPAAGFAAPVPMLATRILHAETLLPDGRVLITGGKSGNVPLSSAELYDPVSKTFSATGSMNVPRTYHTSILLPDGKVLIAVGRNSGGFLSSAELYDPATGLFTYTGSAKAARAEHTATLLPNGKVLFAGGYANGASLSSAELYNPADGTFRAISPMIAARDNHTATLLPNGLVLLAGGTNASGILSTALLYNPATEAFSAAGQLSAPRGLQTAVSFPNGKVLLVGGLGAGYAYLSSAEIYDPGTNTFAATTGQMSTVRNQPVAALLPTGKVLVAGGADGSSALSSTELYDPATGTFTAASSMSTGRDNHTATSLSDGKVMIAGGAVTPSAEVYDPGFSVPVSIALTSVAVLPSSATIGVGATQQFTAAGNFSDGSSRALGALDGLVWSTDNSAVATVSPDGLATGVGNGTARITVSSGIINAEANLTIGVTPPAAGFSATGSMLIARGIHTETLLPNGKVLIVGGRNPGGFISSAELYDPATKTFTATGSLNSARAFHIATLLPNGKVLVAGGWNGAASLSSSELYDPITGAFTATGSMTVGRDSHIAKLLASGKVLIAGGGKSDGGTLSSAEIYDPATGTFTATGSMSMMRQQCSAILLPNGKVLVAGGTPDGTAGLTSVELYDPSAGTFSTAGSMSVARWRHAAALLPNGKVLVAGGAHNGVTVSSAELYDPETGAFSPTGSMGWVRQVPTATLLANGKVLMAAGSDASAPLTSAELYDPVTGTFSATASLRYPRSSHGATLLADGKVLVTGGHDGAGFISSSELYDSGSNVPVSIALASIALTPSSATVNIGATQEFAATGNFSDGSSRALGIADGLVWSTDNSVVATVSPDGLAAGMGNGTARITVSSGIFSAEASLVVGVIPPAVGFSSPVPMLANRILHAETLLPDGRVLITGGKSGNVPLSSAELYDPVSKTFSVTGSMNVPRTYHTSTLLPDGKVLIAVGRNSGGFLSSAELYDPATGRFSNTGSANVARAEYTATLLPNGKVLFAGGYANGASLSSAELYNPADGTFRAISPMSAARDNHTATLLPNGLVLLAGGTNASGTLSTALLYNPATEAFSAAGQLSAPRGLQTAVSFPNGKVLLVGGLGAGYAYLSSAEVYDPGTNTFAATTGQMSTVRNQPVAALLPNGKVLVAGGADGSSALSSTELYDPATGTFSSTGSMSTGRDNHTATSLSDGKVLIAGGAGTPSAEVYDPVIGSSFTMTVNPETITQVNNYAIAEYVLPVPGFVTLEVLSSTAPHSTLRSIQSALFQAAGYQSAQWDGKGVNAAVFGDGAYILRLMVVGVSGNFSASTERTVFIDNYPQIQSIAAKPASFNPPSGERTRFVFSVSEDVILNVAVKDLSGGLIKDLAVNAPSPAGSLNFYWDGLDNSGQLVPPGSYHITVNAVDRTGNRSEASGGNCEVLSPSYPAITGLTETPDPFDARIAGSAVTFSYHLAAVSQTSTVFPVTITISHPLLGIVKTMTLQQEQGDRSVLWDGVSDPGSPLNGLAAPDGAYSEEVSVNVDGQIASAYGAFSLLRNNVHSAQSSGSEPTVTVQYDDPVAQISITQDPPITSTVSAALLSQTLSGNVLASPIFDIVATQAFTTQPVLRFKYDPVFDGESLALYKYSVLSGTWIQVSTSYYVDLANNEIIITLNPDVFMGSLFALMKSDDTLPPVTGLVFTGSRYAAGGNQYISGQTLIGLRAQDQGGSGVSYIEYRTDGGAFASYTAPFTLPAGEHVIEYRSADNAGNIEDVKISNITVDGLAPVSAVSLVGISGRNGWYLTGVDAAINASDAHAGIKETLYSMDGGSFAVYGSSFSVLSEGRHVLEVYSIDNVSNVEISTTIGFGIDTAAPVSTAVISGTIKNGWYSSAVTLDLTSMDGISGVKDIKWSLDGSGYAVYTEPIVVSSEGKHVVSYYAEDMAGNTELSKTIEFSMNSSAPLVDYLLSPLPNLDGWNNGPVNVLFRASDTLSGIEECSSITVTTEGKDQKIAGWCRDLAGNVGYSTATLNIDSTEPGITISSPVAGALFMAGRDKIEIRLAVEDNLDPAPAVMAVVTQIADKGTPRGEGPGSVVVVNGQLIDPLELDDGLWRLEVSARDIAGNSTQAVSGPFEVAHDTMPPQTSLSVGVPNFVSGGSTFITSHTPLLFSATDDMLIAGDRSGVGVAATYIYLDSRLVDVLSSPFFVPGENVHAVDYYSVDRASNTETAHSASFTVDNSSPVSSIAFSGAASAGADGGYSVPSGSSVSFTAADMPVGAASGVSDIWYSVDSGAASVFDSAFALAVGTHTVIYWSVDNLGNTEAGKTALVSVGEAAWAVKLNIEPSTLNLKSKGESVTAKLRFEGSGQACFKPKTLKISAINGLELNNPIFAQSSKTKDDDDSRCGSITVNFDREALIAVLPPNAVSNITVSGALTDGRGFSASDTIKTIKPRKTTRKDGGRLENERRAGFDAPAGALRHDDDLYVLSVEGDYGSSESGKDAAAKARGIARRGIAYEFGPTGTIFDKPVTISLPCDADDRSSEKLAVAYWNEAAGLWELLPSRRDTAARLIKADVPHFSQYQVVLASYAVSSQETVRRVRASEQGEISVSAADSEFKLGEVYVYPNPAKGGKVPTFHVEVGIADIVKIRVYTVAGQLVHERSLAGTPQTIGSVYAYEYAWAGHIASGVYYYTIEAERTGKKLKSRGKFAVVR